MERKTESFERRRCFPRAEPQMPAVPAGWRVDLSLPGMQILHKLYTSSDVGRACVSTRRDVGWNARHEFQPNTAPSSLPLSFLSFFIPPLFFIHARLSIRHACFETNRSRYEDANRKEISDSTFHLGYLVESGGEKLENRVQVFLISLEEINFSIAFLTNKCSEKRLYIV